MALAAGTQFGAYEILSPIGAGGGIFGSRDRAESRAGAIKVLP
jgi:hypothetical protein